MSHKLQTTDLENFESKTTIAGSYGKGENKSLDIVTKLTITGDIDAHFTVRKKDEVVLITGRLIDAILAYNEI